MTNNKKLGILFFSMLKIGLFAFGGGLSVIAQLEAEMIDKRKWITKEEFLDMITISESTPGPVAINCATYVGYNVGKLLGAILATIAVCIPSFVIIFIISLFLNQFLENNYVSIAFKGIQVGVVFLILSAGIKMVKEMKKDLLNIIIFLITFLCVIFFFIFGVNFSSIFYILISAVLGLFIYLIKKIKKGDNK